MITTRTVFLVTVLMAVASVAFAERIYLKNGDVVTGTITESNEQAVVVDTSMGEATIPRQQIDGIEFTGDHGVDNAAVRNGSILIRPLPTVLRLLTGSAQTIMEGLTVFSTNWAFGATFAVNYATGIFGMED